MSILKTDFSHELDIIECNHARISDSNPDALLQLKGGETAGLCRIDEYITNGVGKVSEYKATRNGMIGVNYSSKLSAWLAFGCITSRQIYKALREFESANDMANDSTYWLVFELLWRDYMKLYAEKWGNRLFELGGPQGNDGKRKHPWNVDPSLIASWCEGYCQIQKSFCLFI
jgi:deoxyribodipyrimidine photo-lyase